MSLLLAGSALEHDVTRQLKRLRDSWFGIASMYARRGCGAGKHEEVAPRAAMGPSFLGMALYFDGEYARIDRTPIDRNGDIITSA